MITKLKSPFWRTLYYLKYIPSLWFWKVGLVQADDQTAVVSIKQRWSNKNPFRSIYFGALVGAAELSTGILGLMSCKNNDVSMLVTGVEGNFVKKATGIILFRCDDGALILETVKKAVETGEGQTIRVKSTGINEEGLEVAGFLFTWSFRKRMR